MTTTLTGVPTLRTNLSEYAVTKAMRDGRVKSDLVTLDFAPIPGSKLGELSAWTDVVLGFTPKA